MKKIYKKLEKAGIDKSVIEYLKERIQTFFKEPDNYNLLEITKCDEEVYTALFVHGFVEALAATELIEEDLVDDITSILAEELIGSDSEEEDEEEKQEEDNEDEDRNDDEDEEY